MATLYTPSSPPLKNQAYSVQICLQDLANPGKFKADPTLAAGDVKCSGASTGGTPGAVGNLTVLPSVEPAGSIWVNLQLSAAEMNFDLVFVQFIDQTVPAEWADYAFCIQTTVGAPVVQTTTIATLASQTSFTLTAGSADNSAYKGCVIVVQDVATAVQKAVGVISAYTGATKTITLQTDPAVFTMAAGDIVTILADRSLKPSVDNTTLFAGAIPAVTAGAAGGLFIAGTNAATTITTALTTTFTGNLTGTVSTVTGNVLGNVNGFVGSVISLLPTELVVDYGNVVSATSTGVTFTPNKLTTPANLVGTTIVVYNDAGEQLRYGQPRLVIASVDAGGGDVTLTVDRAWDVTLVALDDNIALFAFGPSDLRTWRGTQPNALSSGRVPADAQALSGDTTAADNAESFFDGTGYAGTNNVIPLVTTTTTATNVTTVNGLAAGVITAASIAADAITAAKVADGTIDAATFAAGAITATVIADNAIDTATFAAGTTIPRVTLADTVTTYTGNTVQTGDAFARLGAPAGASVSADIAAIEAQTDDIGVAGAGLTAITSKTDNLPTDPADESLIIAATDAIMSRLGMPAGVSVSADIAVIEAQTDDIGVAGAGLTALGDTRIANLDATVSSRMATYTQPTGFLAATFPATVASTTNIVGGAITTVTNLTNAPTAGDFTATMKTSIGTAVAASAVASVTGNVGGNVAGSVGSIAAGGITTASFFAGTTIPRVTLADTLTTYTGNTPQTGDSFARIGANGSALTAIGDTRIAFLDAAMSSRTSPSDTQVSNVKFVNDTAVDGSGTSGDPWGPA